MTTPKKDRLAYGRWALRNHPRLFHNASEYARQIAANAPDAVAGWQASDKTLRNDHAQLRAELVANIGDLRDTAVGILVTILLSEAAKNPRVAIAALAELRQTVRYDVTVSDSADKIREAMNREVQGWQTNPTALK